MKDLVELEKQKKILVERFGLFMEGQEKLSPIGARIFATLFVNKGNEITFDELVIFLGASKSTISTNLQSLAKLKMIVYHTKPGDRKKYYSLSPIGFVSRIEEKIANFKTEYILVGQILEYKKAVSELIKDPEDEFRESYPYLDYLSNTIDLLEQLRNHINEKCLTT